MTHEEFCESLTPAQAKQFSSLVVSIREEYHAIYEKNAKELVAAKADDLQKLADQIKEQTETHAKAREDAAKDKQLSLDTMKEVHAKIVTQFAIDLDSQHKQASDEFEKRIDELTTSHNEAVRVLNDDIAKLRTKLNSANERMGRLLLEVPFNPRLIKARSFIDRIENIKLMFTLVRNSEKDPVAKGFVDSLLVKAEDQDSIKLDSPKLTGPLLYCIDKGWLTEEQSKQITCDCTREEAYDE